MSDSALATVPKKETTQQLMAKVEDKRLSFDVRFKCIGDLMRAMSKQMMAALPRHVTADRMIRVALTSLRKNPKLLDCSIPSLFGAITEAATYGWEIGGVLGHAYLVPYKTECQLIPGYKGLIDLCRRSGQISTITLEVVHEGDTFTYSLGDNPKIEHKPNDRDPKRDSKPITHVYAVVRMRDGGIQRSVWSREKIDAHKEQYSQAWRRAESSYNGKPPSKDSFWHTAWPAAAKKTVIRDMINRGLLPVSAEYREAVDRGLRHDEGELEMPTFDALADASDATEIEQIDSPQATEEPDPVLCDAVSDELLEATSITNCNAIRDHWLPKCQSDADRTAVVGKCEGKANEIRGGRGERANGK